MRISDWSSDVCSSDLEPGVERHIDAAGGGGATRVAGQPVRYRVPDGRDGVVQRRLDGPDRAGRLRDAQYSKLGFARAGRGPVPALCGPASHAYLGDRKSVV